MMRLLLSSVLGVGALGLAVALWTHDAQRPRTNGITLAVDTTVVVPIHGAAPGTPAATAADLLATTLASSTGVALGRFEASSASAHAPGGFRFEVRPGPHELLDRRVGYRIAANEVVIWANHALDLPAAASWFLERQVGARWFTPGPAGRELRIIKRLVLRPTAEQFRPGYASRDFYFYTGESAARGWAHANRLVRVFAHGHNVAKLFAPQDFVRTPAMAPELAGKRFFPNKNQYAWQPNLNAPETIDFVTDKFRRELRSADSPANVNFGPNDTFRWDESAATVAAISPLRTFRHRPVMSDALFGFLNAVAGRLAPEFPHTPIATYSYDWTEQVPRGPVHPNILPFLTADRSQWFDAAFRAEDQDLIRRWQAAGPRFIGLYDYLYGAAFLVPRPTLYAVAEPIPFGFAHGARAYFGETHPNWALDGPKLWLAAQLLWDPQQSPSALLDEYYERFWQTAAPAMREFFELCDARYLHQAGPAYWLKFFKDEHQTTLFPADVRARLAALLDNASRSANSTRVRERVAFVRRAFAVTDAFCRYNEARDRLSALALAHTFDVTALREALRETSETRSEFIEWHAALRHSDPLAIATELPDNYLRNDPRPRAIRRLAELGAPLPTDPSVADVWFAGRWPTPTEWQSLGPEQIGDAMLSSVAKRDAHPFATFIWTAPTSVWEGQSEPVDTRRFTLLPGSDGFRTLRVEGASEGGLYQSTAVTPGALYRATVEVRGKVSAGNLSALFLVFADAANKPDQPGMIDRLPIGDWSDWTRLELIVRAPVHARRVTLGLLTNRQVGDDFVEFRRPSLQRLTNH